MARWIFPSRTLKAASSSHLASAMVQLTTDAKASPIMTAFTSRSAFMNIPQGERSCGSRSDGRASTLVAGGVCACAETARHTIATHAKLTHTTPRTDRVPRPRLCTAMPIPANSVTQIARAKAMPGFRERDQAKICGLKSDQFQTVHGTLLTAIAHG